MSYDYLYSLQCLRESTPDIVTTILGHYSDLVVGPLVLVIVAIIYWCVNKRNGLFLCISFIGATFIGQGIKNALCVYRPWIQDPRLHVASIAEVKATGYSMPSIHTTAAMSFLGSIAVTLRKRKWVVALMAILILLVAFSRNWLGCHTLEDVLLGLAIGAIAVAGAWALTRFIESHPEKDIWITIIGIVLAIAYLIFIATKSYPVDFDASGNILVNPWDMQTDCFSFAGGIIALAIAITVEPRYIGFSTGEDVTMKIRILRAIVGILITLLLYVVILPAALGFLDAHWKTFVSYLILASFILFIYPACFKAVERKVGKRNETEADES